MEIQTLVTIICAVCGLSFVALGAYMSRGKGWFLVAGLNAMPKEERDKLNVSKITKAVGKFIIFHGALIVILGFTLRLNAVASIAVLMTLVFASSIYLVVYLKKNS